jgi:glutaredoxin 3
MRYFAPFFLSLITLLGAQTQAINPPPKVVIYTIPGCMGCGLAKSMFEDRGIPYEEIDVTGKPLVYQDMVRKTGGKKTVPQVFINDKYIGGYYDLDGSTLDALKEGKSPELAS